MDKCIREIYIKSIFDKLPTSSLITFEKINNLGQKLYRGLQNDIKKESTLITEEECIDYAYNLVLNRTYEGYISEIDTIYGQLQSILAVSIEPAKDEWDRTYNVDFYINIKNRYIGLQIKPISSGQALNQYQWIEMHRVNHERFKNKFGGKVFFVYSVKSVGKKKKIYNTEIIDEISKEIRRLRSI